MVLFPNAKINLGLFVTEKRADGYHNLETVFYPIPLQDALEVSERTLQSDGAPSGAIPQGVPVHTAVTGDYTLRVAGVPVAGTPEDNLVVKAYRLLREEFALPPIYIYMYKHIPSGAGLGGGSADAAFMMRLLNEKFSLGLSDAGLEERVVRLGADCPFFVRNRPAFATGIGDVLTPLEDFSLRGLWLVVVKGDTFISTREAYSLIRPRRAEVHLPDALRQPVETWRDTLRNDFEASVFPAHPEIAAVKDKLYGLGAVYASMSGSGASVYGLFRAPVEHVEEVFGGMFCRQRRLE